MTMKAIKYAISLREAASVAQSRSKDPILIYFLVTEVKKCLNMIIPVRIRTIPAIIFNKIDPSAALKL